MKILWTITTDPLPPYVLDLLGDLHWNAVFAEDEKRLLQLSSENEYSLRKHPLPPVTAQGDEPVD
jgi:hypothetical protein